MLSSDLPSGCDKNYHKKCAYKVPNNCTRLKERDGVSVPPNLLVHPRTQEVWSGRPLWIDRTLKSRQQVPHTLFVHTFKKPTQCHHCKKLVSPVCVCVVCVVCVCDVCGVCVCVGGWVGGCLCTCSELL